MKPFLFILLLLLNLTICFAQEKTKTLVIHDIDTIDINDKYALSIKLPSKSIKTLSSFEGGFFVSYYIPKDTVVLSIYSGKMSEKPFISGKECIVEDSILIENVFSERSGYCDKCNEKYPNKKGYFREKEFTLLSFTAIYEWIDASKIEFYDKVIDEIQIIER